jgi:subtilisin family serine protease
VYATCDGIGFLSDVVAGVDWVTAHHASPAVANMSVSLDPSNALTTAVTKLWNSGVFVVATAANHNADACLEAGGASGAFTVAASTRTDAKADFSNWGTCVKVYAPGVDIQSTWLGGLTKTLSGTSFAAPHVTGVAALYKATFGDAPSDAVSNWIVTNATMGVVTGNPPSTPNLLLYKSTL